MGDRGSEMPTRRTRSVLLLTMTMIGSLLAACAPPPEPLPDPIIVCSSLEGDITYTPGATTIPTDVTIGVAPGFALLNCSDNTAAGITAGTVTSASVLLPDFACGTGGGTPPTEGTVLGSGSGTIEWSNHNTSNFDTDWVANAPYTSPTTSAEITFTSGLWTGATAVVPIYLTGNGDCVNAPLTSAALVSDGPFVLQPPSDGNAPPPPPLDDILQISAENHHSCAVLFDGTVRCWGWNGYGQLGDGTYDDSNLPVEVVGITNATHVVANEYHSCALLQDGTVRCWGSGGRGELGDGLFSTSPTPVTVSGITDGRLLVGGHAHTCAGLAGGTIECWGFNLYGQLGNGTNTNSGVPTTVIGITAAQQIEAGGGMTCSVNSPTDVQCWGRNNAGQLGDGTTAHRNVPTTVTDLTEVVGMGIGHAHACALHRDGSVDCWGANDRGQLGDGTNTNSLHPVTVVGVSDAFVIGSGWDHACAVVPGTVSGIELECWGANERGQLGNGTTGDSSVPVAVTGVTEPSVVVGGHHTCELHYVLSTSAVSCWGPNTYGELGDGTNTDRSTPVLVRAWP